MPKPSLNPEAKKIADRLISAFHQLAADRSSGEFPEYALRQKLEDFQLTVYEALASLASKAEGLPPTPEIQPDTSDSWVKRSSELRSDLER